MNESELIIVETSQGHKVYIKPRISFGDERAIQNYVNSKLTYNAETNKSNPISIADIKAGNDKAFELLIVKVVMPDGTTALEPQKIIYDMSQSDGKLIKAKIDEIYEASKNTEEAKKNETTSEQEQL